MCFSAISAPISARPLGAMDDLSSLSPDRPNPRAHLASAKSIDVIREDDEEEDESDDVLIELGKH